MIGTILDLIIGPLGAALGAIFAVALAYFRGKSAANAKRDAEQMQNAYENERLRDEIDNRNDSPDARNRLRDEWSRD